jgi:hypothetical protein
MDADKENHPDNRKRCDAPVEIRERPKEMPLYVIPIEHKFLFGEGQRFNR